jgi:hypothetical protein
MGLSPQKYFHSMIRTVLTLDKHAFPGDFIWLLRKAKAMSTLPAHPVATLFTRRGPFLPRKKR